MKNDPPIYTTTKAMEYPRKILDKSQLKKIHELTINKFRDNYDVTQARCQNSVTGEAEINFWGGHEKFIFENSRGAWGHEKFIAV